MIRITDLGGDGASSRLRLLVMMVIVLIITITGYLPTRVCVGYFMYIFSL